MVLMLGVLIYLRFSTQPTSPSPVAEESAGNKTLDKPLGVGSYEERLKIVEDSLTLIAKKIGAGSGTAPTKTPSTGSDNERIKALEDNLASLQKQLDSLKQPTIVPAPPSSTNKSTPLYIPVGSGGSTTDQSWVSMDSYVIVLDPADYPNYSSMQLEVIARLVAQAGTGYARLYNTTDNSALTLSETSTTLDKYSLMSSLVFKLPAGKKTYQLQLKTDKGFELSIQLARIKVNF